MGNFDKNCDNDYSIYNQKTVSLSHIMGSNPRIEIFYIAFIW